MWLGSVPWLVYLAATKQIPWSIPPICTPIYMFLFYGAYKVFWPRIRKDSAEEQRPT